MRAGDRVVDQLLEREVPAAGERRLDERLTLGGHPQASCPKVGPQPLSGGFGGSGAGRPY